MKTPTPLGVGRGPEDRKRVNQEKLLNGVGSSEKKGTGFRVGVYLFCVDSNPGFVKT